jgi:hypothetical protein
MLCAGLHMVIGLNPRFRMLDTCHLQTQPFNIGPSARGNQDFITLNSFLFSVFAFNYHYFVISILIGLLGF